MENNQPRSSWLPAFHRQIRINSEPGLLRAQVVDNVHDIALTLNHDGSVITEVEAEMHRIPWTTCPGATLRIRELIGLPIDGASRGLDKAWQCTHLFDLARLAMDKVSALGQHLLDAEIVPGAKPDTYNANVHIDGRAVLHWAIEGQHILSPPPFAGHRIDGAAKWLGDVNDPEMRMAALQLKRAFLVYFGTRQAEPMRHAREFSEMRGVCFSFQQHALETAKRPKGFRVLANDEVG